MYTLSNFYQSKEWCKLLQIIKNERINEYGEIICEYCGKPILKKYDCIGHHSVMLTEDNVNDYSISLNPNLIQLVHHRCHNRIHNKLGYADRRVYLVWGSPLSGKSSWVNNVKEDGDLIVDMDAIWQCVSGCSRYIRPNRLKSIVFRIRNDMLEMIKLRYGKWSNAYIIGGFPYTSERERLINSLGAEGIFIDTDKAECLRRLHEYPDGRDQSAWEKYIFDWWEKYLPLPPP